MKMVNDISSSKKKMSMNVYVNKRVSTGRMVKQITRRMV